MEANEHIAYLLSEAGKTSCVRSGHVLQISHDEVNRFLAGTDYSGKNLFKKAEGALQLSGGVLSINDSVIDKPYSNPEAAELVDFFRSGLQHKSVKGINLILLTYTDTQGIRLPVNWRVYRHRDLKTRNDYFQDMVNEVFALGLRPGWVVDFLVKLEKNRMISSLPHQYEQVGEAIIAEEGLYTHLKGFDYVKVFRTVDTEGHARHDALYGNEQQPTFSITSAIFKELKQ